MDDQEELKAAIRETLRDAESEYHARLAILNLLRTTYPRVLYLDTWLIIRWSKRKRKRLVKCKAGNVEFTVKASYGPNN